MNDRELLEMAAKAVGIEITWENSLPHPQRIEYFRGMPNYSVWDPLADDGDALRLAVKLHMALTFIVHGEAHAEGPKDEYAFENTSDAGANARRAVVVVAAIIGKDMP